MKIGNKYLYGNGRGNYWPISILLREHAKTIQKKLDNNGYVTERQKQSMESEVRSMKHGIGLRPLRKGLNSKIRHLAKKFIREELNEAYD